MQHCKSCLLLFYCDFPLDINFGKCKLGSRNFSKFNLLKTQHHYQSIISKFEFLKISLISFFWLIHSFLPSFLPFILSSIHSIIPSFQSFCSFILLYFHSFFHFIILIIHSFCQVSFPSIWIHSFNFIHLLISFICC
jgi:hypothetical protein